MHSLDLISRTNFTKINPVSTLIDNHGRTITYLRLAITDRCNLRCRYCMPEKGVRFLNNDELLTFEELERVIAVFAGLGIKKIRVTGGEPFVRTDCLKLLKSIQNNNLVDSLFVTTNGVETFKYMERLKALGVTGINLSLDTLDRKRFWSITGRDRLEKVMQTLRAVLDCDIPLKINSVILPDSDDNEIVKLAVLAQRHPVNLRFIELMPFSGKNALQKKYQGEPLLSRLNRIFPAMQPLRTVAGSTSRVFKVPGYRGTVGLIEGESRKFCSTCNKVRITSGGMLKNCLYDQGVLDVKRILRSGATDAQLSQIIVDTISHRNIDGHETERVSEYGAGQSMATIGG